MDGGRHLPAAQRHSAEQQRRHDGAPRHLARETPQLPPPKQTIPSDAQPGGLRQHRARDAHEAPDVIEIAIRTPIYSPRIEKENIVMMQYKLQPFTEYIAMVRS